MNEQEKQIIKDITKPYKNMLFLLESDLKEAGLNEGAGAAYQFIVDQMREEQNPDLVIFEKKMEDYKKTAVTFNSAIESRTLKFFDIITNSFNEKFPQASQEERAGIVLLLQEHLQEISENAVDNSYHAFVNQPEPEQLSR